MIKEKFIVVIMIVMMAASFLLGGCMSSIGSAEDLFVLMNKKLSDTKSFETDVKLVLDMDYVTSEGSDNMRLDFKEDITAVLGNKEVYIDGAMSVTDVYDEAWQTYLVERENGYASYICADGEWYYEDVDEEYLLSGPSNLFEVLSGIKNCSLKKDNDYIVEADIDSETAGSILNAFYSNILESAFSDGLDISGVTAKLILKADKSTCLPKSLELVFNDCSDVFVGDELFNEVSIKEFKLSAEFSAYDEIDDIDIPANVADLFELPNDYEDESDSEDEPMTFDDSEDIKADLEGYYELSDYNKKKTIGIKEPADFKFNRESDASLISFDKTGADGAYCSAIYELTAVSDDNAKSDIESQMEDIYSFYSADDDYTDMEYLDVKSVERAGNTINYSGVKYHYAGDEYSDAGYFTVYSYRTYIDGYALVCKVTDYALDGFKEIDEVKMAETLFENIKE